MIQTKTFPMMQVFGMYLNIISRDVSHQDSTKIVIRLPFCWLRILLYATSVSCTSPLISEVRLLIRVLQSTAAPVATSGFS